METLKKFSIHLKGITPLVMHNDQGCDPFNPLAKQMKEINALKKKTDAHYIALGKLDFLLGLYYDENIGIHIPSRCLAACVKAAAKKDRSGKDCRAITIDHEIGFSLIGYENVRPDDLWNEKGKNGSPYVLRRTVRVQKNKIMRIRPIFPNWEVKVEAYLDTDCISEKKFEELWRIAGFEKGLLELRPELACGVYGKFTLEKMKEIKIK